MPRISALHMLPSTITTVSAPASSSFRGSLPHPTQPLCTLRGRRRRRLTQHSLPGGLLGLTWAGLAPADRASFLGAFLNPGYVLFDKVKIRRARHWSADVESFQRFGDLGHTSVAVGTRVTPRPPHRSVRAAFP